MSRFFHWTRRARAHVAILEHLARLDHKLEVLMATLHDVQDRVAALQVSVANETTIDQSVLTLLGGLTTTVGDLKQQLADAIAANDPVAIQAVVDALGAAQTTIDANAASLASAVSANTPPAPPA